MKHKTQDLTGALLDAAVALAEGAEVRMEGGEIAHVWWPIQPGRVCWADWQPSTSWAQGGPIIERERVELFSPRGAPDYNRWEARHSPPGDLVRIAAGPSALVAAMRAYVAAKLGDEVDL